MEFQYTIETNGVKGTEVRAAYARAAEVMERNIDEKLSQGVEEVVRTAKEEAPAVTSGLANSIAAEKVGRLTYVVDTPLNYAVSAEKGTGPAVGKPSYFPPPEKLFDYLRSAPSYRGFEWKRGKGRAKQENDLMYRAKGFAWFIFKHGTQPHPFMSVARNKNESRLMQLVRQGVDNGIKEAFA